MKTTVLRLGESADVVSTDIRNGEDEELKISEELGHELRNFGLTPNEARIFIHLGRHGPLKARDVSETLGIHRTETYHLLTHLQNQGLVFATFQHPIKFTAVNFDKALSILIEIERERLITVERRKSDLCDLWESLPKGFQENEEKEVFQIIEGINQVYMKIREMVRTAKKTLRIIVHDDDIPHLFRYGIFDDLKATRRREVVPELISNFSAKNSELRILKGLETHFIHEIGKSCFMPHFVVTDDKEVLFLMSTSGIAKKKFTALWTNYNSLVRAISICFGKLWELDNLENLGQTGYIISPQNLIPQ